MGERLTASGSGVAGTWVLLGRKLVELSTEEEKLYEIHLTSSLDVARLFISIGDAFRGHDETFSSLNKGNYREMVEWYKDKVEVVKEPYDKGSKNCHLVICAHTERPYKRLCTGSHSYHYG